MVPPALITSAILSDRTEIASISPSIVLEILYEYSRFSVLLSSLVCPNVYIAISLVISNESVTCFDIKLYKSRTWNMNTLGPGLFALSQRYPFSNFPLAFLPSSSSIL